MDHVAEFSVRSVLVTWRGLLPAEVFSIERYHHKEKFSGVALLKLFENEGHFFKFLRLAPHFCGLNYRLIEILLVPTDVCRTLGNISFIHCSHLKKLLQKVANSGRWIYCCSEVWLLHGRGIPILLILSDWRIILLLLHNCVGKSCFNCLVATEHEIRKAGRWEEYEKKKVLATISSPFNLQHFVGNYLYVYSARGSGLGSCLPSVQPIWVRIPIIDRNSYI